MKYKVSILIFTIFLFLSCTTGQDKDSKILEMNPEVVSGQLDSGVTYFIQENKKPENRIELRLIVKTGSIAEDEDQKGLAHFVEHMAFNGTENFPKDKLVKYLESLGMGFGPEINAYTSFDETVYKLSIPADDPEVISNAFLILEDWAHRISFEDEEIEKERGVIVEEWRGGRGVQGRFMDRLLPTLLKGSRYSERLTIGDMDVVKYSDPQRLRDYYNEWYRPELMAVTVVGDIESDLAESLISKHFNFTNNNDGRPKVKYSTPILDRVDVEIIPDKEVTSSEVLYLMKRDNLVINTSDNYREYIKELLSIIMFNSRMEEIYTKSESPFLSAGAGFASFVRDISLIIVSTRVEDDSVLSGFEAMLSEIEKVKQHGFNKDEVDRAKSQINLMMKSMYNERNNRESASLSNELISYYLEGNAVMDISYEYDLITKMLADLSYEEVNVTSMELFSSKDRTVTVQIPENDQTPDISQDNIKSIFNIVEDKTFESKVEESDNRPFFEYSLKPGSVESLSLENSSITTLKLSNGATVILKPTDFKSDEINFSAISYGGLSYVDDDEYVSGNIATSVVEMSGLNGFDSIALNRVLTGVDASVSPWIGNYTEGFSGGSSVEDQEVLFQLLNLYFTHPEFDRESYDVLMNNITNYIKNRENAPKTIFSDRVTEILGSGHFRSKPITMESLEEVSFQEVEEIYRERFGDPGDFIYLFTGNFNVSDMIPLINRYIGSIPSSGVKEVAQDLGIRTPDGVIEESIEKGLEEQSAVEIIFTGDFDGTPEDEFLIKLLTNYLEEELRVLIREDLSGTYGVSLFSNISLYPYKQYSLGVYFGCEPGREEELSSAVFELLDKVKDGNINQEGLDAVITNFKRNLELNLKDNIYWLNSLQSAALLNRDFGKISDDDTSNATVDKFVELTKKYFNNDRYIKVILKPE